VLADDELGHGTGIASLIAATGSELLGIAPKASLIVAKVGFSFSPNSLYLKAFSWALSQGADIVSISQTILSADDAFQGAIDEATKKGVFVVAAAGNTGIVEEEYVSYPACYRNVLSIGATGESGYLYKLSPSSSMLDLVAPGEGIAMAGLTTDRIVDSGTSYSAPIAAACIAVLLEYARRKNISDPRGAIEKRLRSTAARIDGLGPKRIGSGCIDPLAAARALS